MLRDGDNTYALRTDGRVYRNTEPGAIFNFDAGGDDGDDTERQWTRMAIDPIDGDLYALRLDGKVIRGDFDDVDALGSEGGPDDGTVVAALPFGDDVNVGTLYWDIVFLDDGSWLALRGIGTVFEEGDVINPIVDYPGDPEDDVNDTTLTMLSLGDDFIVMRRDGKIYLGSGDGTAILDLKKAGYVRLALSNTQPDLTNVKNKKPIVSKYLAKAVTGTPISVPVLAVDEDLIAEDLVITLDETTIPEGAVWDAESRTLSWDDPGPKGKYMVKLTVDDGVAVVKSTIPINVKDPDDNVDKNRKPLPSKIKKATALKGVPLELPILVVDEDGDMLTLSVDETKYPYTDGASFDTKTNVFSWTPQITDVGKLKLVFMINDGTLERTFKVTLKVVNSLLAF